MKRLALLFLIASFAASTFAQTRHRAVSAPNNPATAGEPLRLLSPELLSRFVLARDVFASRMTVADGLGPVMNEVGCFACHLTPTTGGGSGQVVRRVGSVIAGVFDPLANRGGSVLQAQAIGPRNGATHQFNAEAIPAEATVSIIRRAQPLFGLGLVDATPDSTFIALAAQEAARGDGTAGRVNMVDNIAAGMKTAGKFGWKAQIPTLHQFAGDALLTEIGITNPQFPNENCPSGNCAELEFNPRPSLNDDGRLTDLLTDYMAMLAPPPRGAITPDVIAGETVFNRIGCNACHVSTLQTGTNSNPAYDRQTYHPFSDFLLHDMGSLGDGIEQDGAGGREFRTAPLWGLRFISPLLHDRRANGNHALEDAIVAHDGQGAHARDQFNALDAADRAKLLAFLQSL